MSESPRKIPRAMGFSRHLSVFVVVSILGFFFTVVLGFAWPIFWPIAVWSIFLAVHFFFASTADVREEWVNSRAEELRYKSYDFDHIRDIRKRIEQKDPSIIHHAERDD